MLFISIWINKLQSFLSFFNRFHLFICREKREKEKGKKHQCKRNIHASHQWMSLAWAPTRDQPATQACALNENRTGDLSLCRMMPNQLSHTYQGGLWVFLIALLRDQNCILFLSIKLTNSQVYLSEVRKRSLRGLISLAGRGWQGYSNYMCYWGGPNFVVEKTS